MARHSFAGAPVETNLTSSIGPSDSVVAVGSTTGWPNTVIGPFVIVVDPGLPNEEKMLVQAYTTTSLTVETRGYDSTGASSHDPGAVGQVFPCFDAAQFDLHDAFVAGNGTVTPSTSLIGDAATKGSSSVPAAADHVHAREQFQAGQTQDVTSGSSSDGTSTHPARADHVHGGAAGGVSYGTSATNSAPGNTETPGTASTVSRSDHVHGRESLSGSTPLVPTAAGAVGSATTAPHADHQHPIGPLLQVSEVDSSLGTGSLTNKLFKCGFSAVTCNGSGVGAFTYGTAFPSSTDVVIVVDVTSTGTTQNVNVDTASLHASGFSIIASANGSPVSGSVNFMWMAVGE